MQSRHCLRGKGGGGWVEKGELLGFFFQIGVCTFFNKKIERGTCAGRNNRHRAQGGGIAVQFVERVEAYLVCARLIVGSLNTGEYVASFLREEAALARVLCC